MRVTSIISFSVAIVDAIWVFVWAARRSMNWMIVEANFESDVGKGTIGAWHLEHIRRVAADYDSILKHAGVIVVLLLISGVCRLMTK